MEHLPANNSTLPTENTQTVSVRAKSTSDLIQAIHGHKDPAFVLDRARINLRLYFDPNMDPKERAEMLNLYAKALGGLPRWAVSQAYDQWERTESRKPTPADIVKLAEERMRPIREELEHRRKIEREKQEWQASDGRPRMDPEAMQRILDEAGMTKERIAMVRRFPMAGSMDEAEKLEEPEVGKPRHWSDGLPDDHPQMIALRKARAASMVIPPLKPIP